MSSLSRTLRFTCVSSLCVAALMATGCRSHQNSAANATFSSETNIGPIPGDVAVDRPSTDPYHKDPVALEEGRRLYGWYNCSSCHGGHGGGGMGPSLRDDTWIYGGSDDQILNTLIEGRTHGMPAWGTKISRDQMWKIIAYIKSMNTSMEPDPPKSYPEQEVPESEIYHPASQRSDSH